MYLGPFQNKILFQNKCLFLFCPALKYLAYGTHFAKWANSEQIKFNLNFFPPNLSKFKCAKQGIKKSCLTSKLGHCLFIQIPI
jgi:hypothetical protein